MTRCMGRGYKFEYINVKLIDIEVNEMAAHYSASGYLEYCALLLGTIFSDIVNMVSSVWR